VAAPAERVGTQHIVLQFFASFFLLFAR
jgi:hypothetical protein